MPVRRLTLLRILMACAFVWAGWVSVALAQSFPDYQSTTVNDYADLLTPADEAALTDQLERLRQETGVEMTVLTLVTQDAYAPGLTLEEFATRLFDHWGIGDASANDGVLVMIIRDDRSMRLELGAAYGRGWDGMAARVLDRYFLPPLRDNDFPRGIQEGVTATIEQIVLPFRSGDAVPDSGPERDLGLWTFLPFILIFALVRARQNIGDMLARFRTCPQCGARGMVQTRETRFPASVNHEGTGILTRQCLHCDYSAVSNFVIGRIARRHSSSRGGGSSGGGGASGRF